MFFAILHTLLALIFTADTCSLHYCRYETIFANQSHDKCTLHRVHIILLCILLNMHHTETCLKKFISWRDLYFMLGTVPIFCIISFFWEIQWSSNFIFMKSSPKISQYKPLISNFIKIHSSSFRDKNTQRNRWTDTISPICKNFVQLIQGIHEKELTTYLTCYTVLFQSYITFLCIT